MRVAGLESKRLKVCKEAKGGKSDNKMQTTQHFNFPLE